MADISGAKVVYLATIEKESAQSDPLDIGNDEITRPKNDNGNDYISYCYDLEEMNAHHQAALNIKSRCSVGLGVNVIDGDESKLLKWMENVNQYGQSFIEVVERFALDVETCGNGYLEIVRDRKGRVAELYHGPAKEFHVAKRSSQHGFYQRADGTATRVPFMRYTPGAKDENSILHFATPTVQNRYYGLPSWRGCVPDIELDYYATLFNKKFFVNSGIPDIAIIVEGGQFDEATEKAVQSFFQNEIKGVENAHKSLYLPLPAEGVKVRFERIGTEMKDKDGSFEKLRTRCRDNIISAHGVPPRLICVVLSGSLGGSGEVQGQLSTFQEVINAPRQRTYAQKLGAVLSEIGSGPVTVSFEPVDTAITEKDSERYPALVSADIISRDEARAAMGYTEEGRPAATAGQAGTVEKSDDAVFRALAAFRRELTR